MPRGGSKPGERRGGRKKGAPNKIIGAAAIRLLDAEDKLRESVRRAISEFQHIAFLDVGECFESDGTLKPIGEWSEDARRAVASIEVARMEGRTPRTIHKVRFLNKIRALRSIGKQLGMFVDRHAQAALSRAGQNSTRARVMGLSHERGER